MKICMIHPYKAPAKDSMGAERVIESITRGLTGLGHQVVMLIHPDSTNAPAPVVTNIPSDCDILHFHQWEPQRINYDSFGKPWVVTVHGGGSETDPLWIQSTKDNPHVICVSEYIAYKVGVKAFVHTSSNPDDFIFDENKEDYFLWLAGTDWGEGKGLWSTIQIAKKMRIKLKVAGVGQNQQIIDQIKKMCDDKIEYLGAINGMQKSKILSKAQAMFLLTRLNDACPTTVSEAMLSGTPIIASDCGAMPELILEGLTGYICKNENEVVKAIINIKKIKPCDCRQIGLKFLSSLYAGEKYLHFYENMLRFGKVIP